MWYNRLYRRSILNETDIIFRRYPLEVPAAPRVNSDQRSFRATCNEASNGNSECTDPSLPFCVITTCNSEKSCSSDNDCEKDLPGSKYICGEITKKCKKFSLLNRYITVKDGEILIDERRQATAEAIGALKSGASSVYGFMKDQRYGKLKALKLRDNIRFFYFLTSLTPHSGHMFL